MNRLLTALLVLALVSVSVHAFGQRIAVRYDRHLFLPARVAGCWDTELLFDTGCGVLMVDSSRAAQGGMTTDRLTRAVMGGMGSSRTMVWFDPQKIEVVVDPTGQALSSTTSTTVFTHFDQMLNRCNGIAGMSLLGPGAFRLHINQGFIELLPAAELQKLEGYTKIPIELSKAGYVCVPATIECSGGKKLSILGTLDTGCPTAVVLALDNEQLTSVLGYLPRHFSYTSAVAGIGGGADGYMGAVQGVSIGGHRIEIPTVEATVGSTAFAGTDKRIKALLGNELWARFDVVIDRVGKSLYLKPHGETAPQFEVYYCGFLPLITAQVTINGVHPSLSGVLQNGDRITHLDAQPIERIENKALRALFCTPDKQSTLGLLRGDKACTVTITHYNDQTLWQ